MQKIARHNRTILSCYFLMFTMTNYSTLAVAVTLTLTLTLTLTFTFTFTFTLTPTLILILTLTLTLTLTVLLHCVGAHELPTWSSSIHHSSLP